MIEEQPKAEDVERLIAQAHGLSSVGDDDWDEDERWEAVSALRRHPLPAVFEAAVRWCRSEQAFERELGADVLGQLGERPFLYAGPSRELLWSMVGDEDPNVLQSVIVALGHLDDLSGSDALRAASRHPDLDVRHAVAWALGPSSDIPEAEALTVQEILIELAGDPEDEVRSWAVFGLGLREEWDTPRLRDCLREATGDRHDETRGEALLGLALRGDESVLEPLERELGSGCVGTLALEAAERLAHPRLLPLLLAIQEWWGTPAEPIESAIAATRAAVGRAGSTES